MAIGDSYGAGVTSGSLVDYSQLLSYPALVHRQATGGAGGFEQPLVSFPGSPPVLQLVGLFPTVIAPSPGQGQPVNLFLPRPYDNLSVPGTEVGEVLRTVSDNGGSHDLVLRGLGTQLQQALVQSPTFVTVWVGGNDALEAVLSGVVIEGQTLTPLAEFEADYGTLIGVLAESGAQLAIGTLPTRVAAAPFASAIPPALADPASGELIRIGGQLVPLIGPDGPLGPGDFVLLTASPLLAQGIGIPVAAGGSGQPLPDNVVLSAAEVAAIEERARQYNDVIRAAASLTGAALFDIEALIERAFTTGIEVGGIPYTTEFLTGGFFSYDGFHLTPIGYAMFANEVIAAINRTYDGRIPQVNLFPYLFGDEGQPPVLGAAGSAQQVVFTRRAYRNLRKLMGIPKPKKLMRLKRRQD